MSKRALSFFALALVAACSSSNEAASVTPVDGGTTGTGGLPCEVSDVLQANCQKCHGAAQSYGAPMPLLTVADVNAKARNCYMVEWDD